MNGENMPENMPAPEEEPDMSLRRYVKWAIIAALVIIIIGVSVSVLRGCDRVDDPVPDTETKETEDPGWDVPDYVDVRLIPKNEYSRPGTSLEKVNGIVVHYVANPGSTAEGNRSYFAGLAESGATYASSNFIIGLDGEVIQCVPADEVAYASNERNGDTLSIECCHPDETGKFTDFTYKSLVKLCADICKEFGLDPEKDIIRHYDVTGKMCPLYFVEHEDEWKSFLGDVKTEMNSKK